jgi:hypothetical protein
MNKRMTKALLKRYGWIYDVCRDLKSGKLSIADAVYIISVQLDSDRTE